MMLPQKATQQLTKQHNRDLVLKTIIESQETSRAEIARATKLTRTTVSDVVAGLMEEGLVQEIGMSTSLGGKPSILLSLVPEARYLIGLNLAQDKFVGAVVNLRGEIKETIEMPVHGEDGQQALDLVYAILDQLTGSEWKPLIGIGVGAPGLINTREGIVINAVNLEWQDLPLAKLLQQRYHLPVSVMNDSQATAIGEFVYGGYNARSNLVVVNVTHGIGSGILIGGKLFQGDGGGAGEIGHVLVFDNHRLCRCGRTGCLETLASAQAVAQRLREESGAADILDIDEIGRKFAQGDPLARKIVLEAGQHLGVALGNMVGMLNIRNIIVTGTMTRFGQPWLEAIRQAMRQSALAGMTQETKIEPGKLDYRACILGASAHLLMDDYALLFSSSEN